MALLGVLARVEVADRSQATRQLEQIDGVSTFSVDEQERIGILIEASSVNSAHELLTTEVNCVSGVLGTWPVFSHFEDVEPSHDDVRPTIEK